MNRLDVLDNGDAMVRLVVIPGLQKALDAIQGEGVNRNPTSLPWFPAPVASAAIEADPLSSNRQ